MPDLKTTLEQIKSEDMKVRYAAFNAAGPLGPQAVAPLADLMKEDVRTVGRDAMLALQNIVNYTGRPGAQAEAKAVTEELMKVASSPNHPRFVRVDTLTWIGYIGGPDAVPGLVKLLDDRVIREEARTALERIPGDESLAALNAAAQKVTTDFRKNIQQSIRNRSLTSQTVGIGEGVKAVS
jgi:HEAT repeat protein